MSNIKEHSDYGLVEEMHRLYELFVDEEHEERQIAIELWELGEIDNPW